MNANSSVQSSASVQKTGVQSVQKSGVQSFMSSALLIVPLLLCNGVAIFGQTQWALDNLTETLIIAIAFAGALESIGAYIAFEAHSALLNGASSGKLRGASYAIGILVGLLNGSHWSVNGHWTSASFAFGSLSALSPWLWSIRSRRLNREQLRSQGLIEERAVKFSTVRWMLFPMRTLHVFKGAVWAAETDPNRAVELFDLDDSSDESEPESTEIDSDESSDTDPMSHVTEDVHQEERPVTVTAEPVPADPEKVPAPASDAPKTAPKTARKTTGSKVDRAVIVEALRSADTTVGAFEALKSAGHAVGRTTVFNVAKELREEETRSADVIQMSSHSGA